MRWLFSILITVAFAAGIYFFYQTWADYHAQQAELVFLEKEQANYAKLKDQYAEQEKKVVLINSLWDEIETVGLAPDNWVEYPLSIKRSIPWEEFDRLLLLAANRQGEGGYWFKPQRLRVSRVITQLGGDGQGDGGGNAQTGEPVTTIVAKGDDPTLQQEVRFDTTLQGKFMIPKQ